MTQPKIEYEKAKCARCGNDSPFGYELLKHYYLVFCGDNACQGEMKKLGHTRVANRLDGWCVIFKFKS